MTKRILHISKYPSGEYIYGSDFNGRVHKMTLKLEVICQSDSLPGRINSLYTITCNKNFVFGRDIQGNLIQWNAADLSLNRIIYLENTGDKKERTSTVPIPTVSHGLFLWQDRIIVASPYGDLIQFDSSSLEFIKRTNLPSNSFVESFDGTLNNCHVLSDCAGYVWYGHIDKGFEKSIRLDFGPIHCLRYDKLHNRHWMTTDNHGGFSIVELKGNGIKRVEITTDDVEWLAISDDAKYVYVACFDHYLYIFNNTEKEPQLIQKIGPFKFQLKQVLFVDQKNIYVSLESGEIYHLDEKGNIQNESPFGTNCIWDIVQDPLTPNRVYCPMEDGSFAHIEYDASPKGKHSLNVISKSLPYGFGRIRRIKPLENGTFIAGCTDGTVLKINSKGGIEWQYLTRSIVRDISISPKQTTCLSVNEAGEAIQFSVKNGHILWQENFDRPLWASCFYGNDILVSERCRSEKDENKETTLPIAHLYRINGDTKELSLSIEVKGNIKRIKTLENGNILFNGNGDVSAVEYNLDSKTAIKSWSTWQLNTCEDVIQFKDYIYTVTYGYQLNTYKKNGEMIDCQFSADNYPKAIYGEKTESGEPILLVAGRGPFISLYNVLENKPAILQTLYIN